jgi:hypothetical protein
MRRMALLIVLFPALLFARHPKPCLTADEASRMTNKDLCVDAHVYDVVQLPDGTRFLDVCSPDTPDELCRFTIVSLRADREDVGDLRNYRDSNVHIRGIVQPMHGRAGIMLSHSRQFTGGPPKFKPNPRLIRGFSGDQQRPPISDPNLRSHGGHRAFMSTRDQIPLDKSTTSPK